MVFCSICKFQVVDSSTSVCPNCGAPLENAASEDETGEPDSPPPSNREDAPGAENDNSGIHIPQPARNEDDNLQICDPGDLLCQPQGDEEETAEAEPVRPTPPPPAPPDEGDEDEEDVDYTKSPDDTGGIKKLSDEQVNNIRSNLLNGDSEYVSAHDASSIIHDLSKSGEGPSLRRKDTPPPEDPPQEKAVPEPSVPVAAPAPENQKNSIPLEIPKAAPNRRVAYFHKNFIQLTGPIHPTNGEDMVIDDRHYVLKPKKIKPQYTIGVFSVLVVLLLFLIGKQFISPTLPGSGSIIGVILDDNGQPLIGGAEISLPESGKKVVSDAIGFFRFDNVPTGVYAIRYTLPDGRVGADNISVANDQITLLSLSTENAQEAVTAKSSRPQASTQTGRNNAARNVPPVPDEKKQVASQPTGNKKEYSALKLRANVDDAKLIVNGETLGMGNMTYKKLGPGKHKVKVSKSGYKAWTGTISLNPNETYTLSVNLEKVQAEPEQTTYSADDFYQSGKTMLADGNMAAAISDFTEAIKLKPSMADAHINRAEAYLAGGQNAEAEADYIRAGEIYVSQKRTQSAMSAFNKAISINNESVIAYINRGDLYQRLDDRDKALEDFKKAVKIDSENYRGNFELGKIYFAMGNNKEADKKLRKARDLNPQSAAVYHYLMLNYFARDDFGKVKKTYGEFKVNVSEDQQQAFKENPRFDAILRIVGEYERP